MAHDLQGEDKPFLYFQQKVAITYYLILENISRTSENTASGQIEENSKERKVDTFLPQ